MPERSSVLKNFLKNPRKMGALFPSGDALVRTMTQGIPPDFHGKVVEVGLGSGVITQAIEKNLRSPEHYLGIELDPTIQKNLSARFPKLRIIQDSAVNLDRYLEKSESVDRIVCSLPWAFFTTQLQMDLLQVFRKALKPDGFMTTYLYLQSPILRGGRAFLKHLPTVFQTIERSPLVIKNFPPAYVYKVSSETSSSS